MFEKLKYFADNLSQTLYVLVNEPEIKVIWYSMEFFSQAK